MACAADENVAEWHLAATAEPAALLSVWGTSERDVWVTGGRSELAGAPALLHYDGTAWRQIDSGQRGIDLWWVFGFDGGDVFFSGSGGTILRYRDAAFEKMITPRSGKVFGMWGAAPDDLWAVGAGDDGAGIVWHYDGAAWQDARVSPEMPGLPGLVFKVHGQRADDVWISCAAGVTLHWDGAALSRVPTGTTTSSLFSIVTTPDAVIAVGGYTGLGEIVEHTAAGWAQQPSLIPVAWRGVAAGSAAGGPRGLIDHVYAVGESGAVAQRTASAWRLLDRPPIQQDFHAAWVDPQGGLWGVGGKFETLPLTQGGFLAHYGISTIGEVNP